MFQLLNMRFRQHPLLPVTAFAQEVQQVVPQAVIKGSDGYYAVDYARLVPLLIQGMKEQQLQLDEQRQQIAKLMKLMEQAVQ